LSEGLGMVQGSSTDRLGSTKRLGLAKISDGRPPREQKGGHMLKLRRSKNFLVVGGIETERPKTDVLVGFGSNSRGARVFLQIKPF
jgi:hypothetical protein